jgi:hypothetical protein
MLECEPARERARAVVLGREEWFVRRVFDKAGRPLPVEQTND